MALFKTTPGVPDGERARLEFHFQQIADCIGFERFRLPFISESDLIKGHNTGAAKSAVSDLKDFLGRHLKHDTSELQVQTMPMQLQKIGGGG